MANGFMLMEFMNKELHENPQRLDVEVFKR